MSSDPLWTYLLAVNSQLVVQRKVHLRSEVWAVTPRFFFISSLPLLSNVTHKVSGFNHTETHFFFPQKILTSVLGVKDKL